MKLLFPSLTNYKFEAGDLVRIGANIAKVQYVSATTLDPAQFKLKQKVSIIYLEGPNKGGQFKFDANSPILIKLTEDERALFEVMNS